MSKLKLERKVPRDRALAIQRAVTWLVANGYESEGAAYGAAQLTYVKGTTAALRLPEHRHTLRILDEHDQLVFEFTAGFGSSGFVSGGEREELEARVDAALGYKPAAPTQLGCRICGQLNAATAASCEACGSTDFR